MGIAKITRNYQITLPKDVREVKRLKEGDSVVFTIENDRVQLMKAEKDATSAAAGIWKRTKESGVIYERRIREGWKKRIQRERHDAD